MRSVENDDLVFPEGEIPARCVHCQRDGELTLRVTCGKIGLDGRPVTPEDARMFRPERLILMVAKEEAFVAQVARIDIGSEPCMATQNPLVAMVFDESGVDPCVTFPTVAPGIEATLVLRNPSDKPIKVAAKFRGTSAYLDPNDYAAGTRS